MYRKVIPSVLGIFCLALAVQSQMPEGFDLDQFYGCFTYALCDSDGQAHQDIMKCFNSPTDQDRQPIIGYVQQNFYSYNTDSIAEALQIYCTLSGDAQVTVCWQKSKYEHERQPIFLYGQKLLYSYNTNNISEALKEYMQL
ncbi:hypothetical protein HNY73_021436 [Argiope bruennichi]|uniref:Uncharacterized protein n=1 Tax=Argiope bruennichi TaxID=94029 RepID=A0A8T0DYI9_ARGBR|nr:hypothetical protein HNY73_021436 [Argiope bruennichi]